MSTESMQTVSRHAGQAMATNKVIRNTFLLLSMTLGFSAITAGYAMASGAPMMHWLIVLGVFIGGPFVINMFRNSAFGLVLVFAFTGFMGYVLGPILNVYLSLPNGEQIVATSLGLTAAIFLGLTGYAMVTRKDFSFMGGFLAAGFIVILAAMLLNFFFLEMPILSLVISAAAVILLSAGILYEVSAMVNGGETNYIMMTVALYTSIFALFTHLLNLVSAFSGD